MIRGFYTFLILLILQACQVKEEVASSKQIVDPNLFPNSRLTAVFPKDGWKKLGDQINVTMLFPSSITVTGTPYIAATIGNAIRKLNYVSGSGSGTLVFRYTVTSADLDENGISISNTVSLNSGSMKYLSKTTQVDNVPTNFAVPHHEILVDGVIPVLNSFLTPASGTYPVGQYLRYKLGFSENVVVAGLPAFQVNFASGTVAAEYHSGSGMSELHFRYGIKPSDSDNGTYSTGTTFNFSTNPISPISIKDQAGNPVSVYLPLTSSPGITINVITPTIVSVTPPAAATYVAGQNMNFTVTMSQAVNVTGFPALPFQTTTGILQAKYLSGSGTNTLIFRHTVINGQEDLDGITLLSPMLLNGGTILNLLGTQSSTLNYTVPSTAGRLIDAVLGPSVLYANIPANGMYIEGQVLEFALNYNSTITVTGLPQLSIMMGATNVFAIYQPGLSTTVKAVFRYVIAAGVNDLDGVTLNSPMILNGGTIRDSLSRDSSLFFPAPDTTGILVDGLAPSISNVAALATGTYVPGQSFYFSATFSEDVIVTGTPRISLTVGSSTVYANYESGSGSNVLQFKYTVGLGDADSNGIVVNSPLSLNGGTIKDARNHNTSLIFTPPSTNTILIDGSAPSATLATGPAPTTYKLGQDLLFKIDWSEPVFVSGTPYITLNIGGTPVQAMYQPLLGDSDSLFFKYTVQSTHLDDVGGIGISSPIVLNTGSIQDSMGNNAALSFTLPTLTTVFVDGISPTIASIASPANGTHIAGANLDFTVTWSEPVIVTGSPFITINLGAGTVTGAFVPGASPSTTSLFRYSIVSGDLDTNGISILAAVFLNSGTIRDVAGNDAGLAIITPNLTAVNVDAVIPTIITVSVPVNETYKIGESLDFKVFWSEPIIVTGTPRIAVTVGVVTVYATYVPADSTAVMSLFRFTVLQGHTDTNGIQITSPIDLNLGTIRDAGTNIAVLTYTNASLAGVLVDGIRANINPANPVTHPAAGTYKIGDTLNYTINWTENVTITGSPYITIYNGSTHVPAYYASGSGTPNIVFSYLIPARLTGSDSIHIDSPVQTNGGTIRDIAPNDAYTTFASAISPGVIVDAILPKITSMTSINVDTGKNNFFKPNQTIEYQFNFSEAMVVTGVPTLEMSIGSVVRYASYFGGTGTTQLRFRVTLDANNVLLDLDGIGVASAFSGGTIKDVAGNDFSQIISFAEKDYVHYSNMFARYHIDAVEDDYDSVPCGGTSRCLTKVYDIIGNGHDLIPTTSNGPNGPVVDYGFGGNSTGYMQFNNSSGLKFPNNISIKNVIFVLKTVTNSSIDATTSTHSLLTRWNQQNFWNYYWQPLITLTSNASNKGVTMYPTQKMKINAAVFPPAFVSSESSPTLWAPDTAYIFSHEFSAQTVSWANTTIGGTSFNGQVAEAIFFTGTVTEAQIDAVRDQLNSIHDVY